MDDSSSVLDLGLITPAVKCIGRQCERKLVGVVIVSAIIAATLRAV